MEFTLLAAALTGIGAMWAALRAHHAPKETFDALLGAVGVGIIVGRIAAMIGDGLNPITSPADLIVIRGGVDTGFAALTAVVVAAFTLRSSDTALSLASVAGLVGLAGWHAGCLWTSSCLGSATGVPWAWALPGSEVTRHPVGLYTALLLAIGAAAVSRLPDRQRWFRPAVAVAVAATARLVTEPLRLTVTTPPIGWYLAGLVAGVITAAVVARPLRSEVRTPG